MANLGKELERSMERAGTDGAALASAEANVNRIAFDIDRVREWSKGAEADQRSAIDRSEVAAGRERDEAKSLHTIL